MKVGAGGGGGGGEVAVGRVSWVMLGYFLFYSIP